MPCAALVLMAIVTAFAQIIERTKMLGHEIPQCHDGKAIQMCLPMFQTPVTPVRISSTQNTQNTTLSIAA